ncbi:MAG: DUF2760 domain-containing protein [Pirellulales bacterium]|nr:DUF2760 domain-containing protein [Pirellulales bacterium]
MRWWLAVRAFFKILFDGDFAGRVRQADQPAAAPQIGAMAEPAARRAAPEKAQAPAPPPARSDAVALLAALQREARFVDIVSESLDGYSDAQIGAAARDVLRDARKVIDRMFGLRPVVESPEGQSIDVPVAYDAGRFRLTGNVARQPPLSGELVHGGWEATRCDVPAWTGSREAALVVAPAEVQVG